MRSGCSCCASSRASSPSRAVRTLKPALRSLRETTWRMWVSSSATRIFLSAAMSLPSLGRKCRSSSVAFSLVHRSGELQLEAEGAALADVAFDEDSSAVDAFDDLLDQGESQS